MWPSVNYTALKFAEGHSLFQLYSTTGLISLATEKIRFGVLPYPKFDEKQENYRSLNWNGLMGVPASVSKAGNPQMVGEVLAVMRTLAKEGITMIIVTHEMAFARDVSNHVVFMADGVIEEEGTPADIFGNPQKAKTKEFLSRFIQG